MRLHSDTISPMHVIHALQSCKERGLIAHDVQIDIIEPRGSRKRKRAIELQIGSSSGESFISRPVLQKLSEWDQVEDVAIRRASRRHVRQNADARAGLHRSATWHEWGHLIAYLFRLDPFAIIGNYDMVDSFEWQTCDDPNLHRYALDWNGRCYWFARDLGDVEALPTLEASTV